MISGRSFGKITITRVSFRVGIFKEENNWTYVISKYVKSMKVNKFLLPIKFKNDCNKYYVMLTQVVYER